MNPTLRTSLLSLALVGVIGSYASDAKAQSFQQIAENATEMDRDLEALAAPLFHSCEALVGRSREQCDAQLEASREEISGGRTLLISLPATEYVTVGPYEPGGGGFRIRIPGIEIVRARGGVVSSRPRRGGTMPSHLLAESFIRVPEEEAEAWAARNRLDRLRLRMVFRFGARYSDTSVERAEERQGVVADVRAAQVFNESTGAVLLDSARPRGRMPAAPDALTARRALWLRGRGREVIWTTPDGDEVLFYARAEPIEGSEDESHPSVLATRRADIREIVSLPDADSDATIDLVPQTPNRILLVITEQSSRRGQPGRGRVLLLRWNAARAHVEVAAEWTGSNQEEPPSWVRDPNAGP